VLTCIPRATVSAVFCLVVTAFICIDLLISRVLKINDDDDDDVVRKIDGKGAPDGRFASRRKRAVSNAINILSISQTAHKPRK